MALEEIHPETLDYLRPLLRKTLDTGDTVQLPYRAWFLHAQTLDGRLYVSLWWGIADSAPPLTMQVERSDPPYCIVSTTDSTDLEWKIKKCLLPERWREALSKTGRRQQLLYCGVIFQGVRGSWK